LTSLEDALHAAECGADAVGFIFYPPSPRFISPTDAKRIIERLPGHVAKVGVFVNQHAAEVKKTSEYCNLNLIQLHGDESPKYCQQFSPETIVKTVFDRKSGSLEDLQSYRVRAFLVDARRQGLYGGTGLVADWGFAARIRESYPLILAGGLKEGNVSEAIRVVHPHAMDINSGVEKAPGKKDQEKMKNLIRMIKDTDQMEDSLPIRIFCGDA
jgi:phosphoribosylanthranilate isomerase